MHDQTRKPPPGAATIVMAAILVGAVMIAVIGTFLPGWVGLTGGPAIAMQLVFYAIAAVDVAVAFWLRANLGPLHQALTPALVEMTAVMFPVQAAIFLLFRLDRGIWRFVSLAELAPLTAPKVGIQTG